jgi:hypothetical protein
MAANSDSKRSGPIAPPIAVGGVGMDTFGEKQFPVAQTENGALLYEDVVPIRDHDDTTTTIGSVRSAEKLAQEQLLTIQLSELLAVSVSTPTSSSSSSSSSSSRRSSTNTNTTSLLPTTPQALQSMPGVPIPIPLPSPTSTSSISSSSPTSTSYIPSSSPKSPVGSPLSSSRPSVTSGTALRQFRWSDLDFLAPTQLALLTKLCQALERNNTLVSLRVIGAKSTLDKLHLYQEV